LRDRRQQRGESLTSLERLGAEGGGGFLRTLKIEKLAYVARHGCGSNELLAPDPLDMQRREVDAPLWRPDPVAPQRAARSGDSCILVVRVIGWLVSSV
jgi:hypothetical protein